jgi:hypothetical protein
LNPPVVNEEGRMDFLYDPRTGRCVAWTLRGDIFNAEDRKIATSDDTSNVYALNGKLVGHLDGDGLTAMPDAFAQFFTKAVRN